jgi:hypothetical protein
VNTVLRLLVVMTAVTVASGVSARSAEAQRPGWGVGFRGHDGEYGFEFRKDVWLGGDVSQVTTQLGILFPRGGAWVTADADYHFVLSSGSGRFYPLVGLGIKTDFDAFKFGVNAGGGFNFMLTESLAAFAELKYVFGGWDGFGFVIGAYF